MNSSGCGNPFIIRSNGSSFTYQVDKLLDSLLKRGWVSIVIISTTVHSGMNKYIPRMRNETAKGG